MVLGGGLASGAYSDCGSVPFYVPVIEDVVRIPALPVAAAAEAMGQDSVDLKQSIPDGLQDIKFDSTSISVFEPGQRAIILWNGEEQILLLSTDQYSTQDSHVMEVIPMPSQPSIREGNFQTFEQAQKLLVKNQMWVFASGGAPDDIPIPKGAYQVTFHNKIGVHDLTVARIEDTTGFQNFANDYLGKNYGVEEVPIHEDFLNIISSYIREDYEWFAFDVINLRKTTNTRQPIQYRFKSDHAFYPMRISSNERGNTNVQLLLITPSELKNHSGLQGDSIEQHEPVKASAIEVEQLSPDWAGFFGDAETVYMHRWGIEGDIQSFTQDVKSR